MKRLINLSTILLLALFALTNCQKDSDNGINTVDDDELTIHQLADSEDEDLLYELGIDDG